MAIFVGKDLPIHLPDLLTNSGIPLAGEVSQNPQWNSDPGWRNQAEAKPGNTNEPISAGLSDEASRLIGRLFPESIDPLLLAFLEHAREPGVSDTIRELAKIIDEALVRRANTLSSAEGIPPVLVRVFPG